MIENSFDQWLGKSNEELKLESIGQLTTYQFENNVLTLMFERALIYVAIIDQEIVRIKIVDVKSNEKSMSSTIAVIANEALACEYSEAQGMLMLKKEETKVILNKQKLLITVEKEQKQFLTIYIKDIYKNSLSEDFIVKTHKVANGHIYGLGEKTGYLDKNGESFTMYNTDVYKPHNQDTNELYQSHPFYIFYSIDLTYGLFIDNPSKTHLDFVKEDQIIMQTHYGAMDLYIYINDSIKGVVKSHTRTTGTLYMPPKWALGYHQSKWGYRSAEDMLNIVSEFNKRDIPLDVIHFDIDYMDGYRVYTFSDERFENPKETIEAIKAMGVHVVPIVDPGVKQDGNYKVFQEGIANNHFCQYEDGRVYIDNVWPGDSAFPDFSKEDTCKWWGDNHQFYTDLGIDGIWNDMNEPAIVSDDSATMNDDVYFDFDGHKKRHPKVHNLYGLMMSKATKEGLDRLLNKRSFVLTRAGYPGIQRYAAVWTGDNRSFWEHLQMFIPMCMNLSLSGVSFCGPDIGGFSNDCNGELLTRWTQAATFSPFYRNHNSSKVHQEPWAFGEEYEVITRDYIRLRYEYMPFIYQQVYLAHVEGTPIMRPLIYNYENDENCANIYDQYMVGEDLIVAPILWPSKDRRIIYLPKGKWYSQTLKRFIDGETYHIEEAKLDVLPLFMRDGAIIPTTEAKKSAMTDDQKLIFNIYASEDVNKIEYEFYDDDGESFNYQKGEYIKLRVQYECADDEPVVTITKIAGNYVPSWQTIEVIWCGSEEKRRITNIKRNNL